MKAIDVFYLNRAIGYLREALSLVPAQHKDTTEVIAVERCLQMLECVVIALHESGD